MEERFKKLSPTDGAGEGEAEDNKEKGGNAMLRLPYAIAKNRGISTDGLTPSQVWQKLKGIGVYKAEEEKYFKETHGQESEADNKQESKPKQNDTSKSLSESLYSPESKVHSKEERNNSFKYIGKTTVAQVTADYVLDNVDGRLITLEDLKHLEVKSGRLEKRSIAQYEYYKSLKGGTIIFNAKGFVPTDAEIEYVRKYYGENYNHTTMYRVSDSQRVKVAVDHEVGHFIDHKALLNYGERASDVITRELSKRNISVKQLESELSNYSTENTRELFAEGYAAIKNIAPEKYTPVMKAFAEEFNKFYGGKI